MRALVLGGSGMLGHTLGRVFSERFETYVTVRSAQVPDLPGIEVERVLTGVSAESFDSVVHAVGVARPHVVVNCIGIVKQLEAAQDPLPSISVNALFPHRLAELTHAAGVRLFQISTDCVFSGRKGAYTEADEADPVDLYGRTKLLGEVSAEGALTVRTSIVGRELGTRQGLLEWFLAQNRSVRGYTRAVFSGLTNEALSVVLADIATDHPDLFGVWHVASEPIDKFELLKRFADAFDRDVEIVPDESVVIDRSLDGSRFAAATGIATPSWDEMLRRLAAGEAVRAG